MKYAEVAVDTPPRYRFGWQRAEALADEDARARLLQTFHYAIPVVLAGQLTAGHLVQVPFGKDEVRGVVVALSDTSPVSETRYLTALMDETPVMTPAQIALGRWIAGYYLVPLFSALEPMLPPGMDSRARLVISWRYGGPPPPDLPADVHAVAELLYARGQLRAEQLGRSFPERVWRKAVDQLSARSLVSATAQLAAPAARIRVEQMARALTDQPRQALLASRLGMRTKDAELLRALWESPEPAPELDTLCAAAGCDRATAASLEKRGLAHRLPGGRLALAIPRSEVADSLLALRRLTKYLPILEYLIAEGKPVWVGAVYAETGAGGAQLRELADAGLIALTQQERIRDPLAGLEAPPDVPPRLTPDQERAWQPVEAAMAGEPAYCVFLLHGVTGSGKTEIYLRALERTLAAGRQAIVLVPEIALTPQTVRRFAARFPGRITTIHSELSAGERYDQWRRIRAGQVDVVIGPRSAIFAPLPRLGLIVVDEEHEPAYKSEHFPTYHAREVALERARLERCPILLGSATPSLESYYRALQGEYRLLELPNRVMGHRRQIEAQSRVAELDWECLHVHPLGPDFEDACFMDLPEVEIVDMRDELRAGNRSIFSRTLQAGLQRVLDHHEQAILFLNRRGLATNVSCRDCGYVVTCPRCQIPLTYHSAAVALVCHHCNYRQPSPSACPRCGSRRIRYLGTGTERVEEVLHELFPQARTLRWDRDVTGAKGAHQAILDQFIAHDADVLIGTQMIAKGLDLPLVTLVGVVLADTSLYLPDFRAAERTFQLLAQVAGRAGRSVLGGSVVVQTYTPEHYSLQTAARHDYAGFYAEELRLRRELGYPPFSRLAKLVYVHKDERKAQAEAGRLAEALRRHLSNQSRRDASLIGPVPCFFERLRDAYRWQVVLRAEDPAETLARFALPAGWRLDVDPVSLL
jgi:primosomal protein N' (replication factor Y)